MSHYTVHTQRAQTLAEAEWNALPEVFVCDWSVSVISVSVVWMGAKVLSIL